MKILLLLIFELLTALNITFSEPVYSLPKEHFTIADLESDRNFMIGLWRGFHENSKYIVYYGYDLRDDGTFLGRSRVYRKETTIKDEFWQGTWNFDGEILTLEGFSKTEPKTALKLTFRLAEDSFLYNTEKTDFNLYLPVRLGKQK